MAMQEFITEHEQLIESIRIIDEHVDLDSLCWDENNVHRDYHKHVVRVYEILARNNDEEE